MDWGSVADWVMVLATIGAVVVAGIALKFSWKANQIAQQVYADDVRARNEAQARMVYPLVRGASVYFKGEAITRHGGEHSMTQVGGNVLGSSRNEAGEVYALEDLQIIDFVIFNGSSEIIGAFQAQLYDLTQKRTLPGSIGADVVLPGGETPLIRIAVPGAKGNYLPEISFRDSAGLFWSRRGFDPIESLDADRRKLFADLFDLRGIAGEG